jgi:hypothetical protein
MKQNVMCTAIVKEQLSKHVSAEANTYNRRAVFYVVHIEGL